MHPSNNALNTSVAESAHDVTQEFLKQNQIIDEELNKYDQMLDSWPMILYRIWIFLYAAVLSAGIIALLLYFVPVILKTEGGLKYLELLLLILAIGIIGAGIYGCIQMRLGLYSRDIAKVKKAISIYEEAAKYCTYVSVSQFVRYYFAGNPWTVCLICLVPMTIALINLAPAEYAKGVLEKREVFQRVSSNPNNAI